MAPRLLACSCRRVSATHDRLCSQASVGGQRHAVTDLPYRLSSHLCSSLTSPPQMEKLKSFYCAPDCVSDLKSVENEGLSSICCSSALIADISNGVEDVLSEIFMYPLSYIIEQWTWNVARSNIYPA